MEPDTLILSIYGTDYSFEIVTGVVLRVGSDIKADICLQGEGVAHNHCTIEALEDGRFRLQANDAALGFSVNGVAGVEMMVRTPFILGVADRELGVRLGSQIRKTIALPSADSPARTVTQSNQTPAGLPAVTTKTKTGYSPAPAVKLQFSLARVAILFVVCLGVLVYLLRSGLLAPEIGENKVMLSDRSSDNPPATASKAPEDLANNGKKEEAAAALKPAQVPAKRQGESFSLGDFRYRITRSLKTSVIGGSDMDGELVSMLGEMEEFKMVEKLLGVNPMKQALGESNRNTNSSYLVVRYEITNLGKEADYVSNTDFKVVDSQGRRFSPSTEGTQKLVELQGEDIFLSELQPGITRAMAQAFELPNDAFSGKLEIVVPEKGFFKSDSVKVVLELSSGIGKNLTTTKEPAGLTRPLEPSNQMRAESPQTNKLQASSEFVLPAVLKQIALAISVLREEAANGNARSAAILSVYYDHGYGVEMDPKQQFVHALKSSDTSNPLGIFALAVCYYNGAGVIKNKVKADELIHSAFPELLILSGKGDPWASYAVAVCFRDGGVLNATSRNVRLCSNSQLKKVIS